MRIPLLCIFQYDVNKYTSSSSWKTPLWCLTNYQQNQYIQWSLFCREYLVKTSIFSLSVYFIQPERITVLSRGGSALLKMSVLWNQNLCTKFLICITYWTASPGAWMSCHANCAVDMAVSVVMVFGTRTPRAFEFPLMEGRGSQQHWAWAFRPMMEDAGSKQSGNYWYCLM